MRAIKIDVIKKDIYEIDIAPGIHAMYAALEIKTPFTHIRMDQENLLWLDDEGLIREIPIGAFEMDGYPQVLSGHGLIIGVDAGGESISTKLAVELVRDMVTFKSPEELPEPSFQFYSWDSK